MAELYSPEKRGQIQRVLLLLFHGLSNALAVMVIDLTRETEAARYEAGGTRVSPGSLSVQLARRAAEETPMLQGKCVLRKHQ